MSDKQLTHINLDERKSTNNAMTKYNILLFKTPKRSY